MPLPLTLVVPTVRRPDCAIRLIFSVRKIAPAVAVNVVDQDGGSPELRDFCERNDVRYTLMTEPPSLTRARNILVDQVTTDFFLLADDDLMINCGPEVLEQAIDFMRLTPNVAFLAGDVREFRPAEAADQMVEFDAAYKAFPKARNIMIDSTGKGVIIMPAMYAQNETVNWHGESVIFCDYVPNWGIGRRSAYGPGALEWDTQFPIRGEHWDFALTRQRYFSHLRFALWPKFLAEHRQVRNKNYAGVRTQGDWVPFAHKWGVEYLCHIGGSIRRFDRMDHNLHVVDVHRVQEGRSLGTVRATLARYQKANQQQGDTIKRQAEVIRRQLDTIQRQTQTIERLKESRKAP